MTNAKIISFVSQKPEVGKSTLARSLAHELTRKNLNLRILLADCDERKNNSYN